MVVVCVCGPPTPHNSPGDFPKMALLLCGHAQHSHTLTVSHWTRALTCFVLCSLLRGEMMKLRQLESELSQVSDFESPSVVLEQVSTSAEIAARMVFAAATAYDDVHSRLVVWLLAPAVAVVFFADRMCVLSRVTLGADLAFWG
jgi:hypothetical protein